MKCVAGEGVLCGVWGEKSVPSDVPTGLLVTHEISANCGSSNGSSLKQNVHKTN